MINEIKTLLLLQESCDSLSNELTKKYYGKEAIDINVQDEFVKFTVLEIYSIEGQVRVHFKCTDKFGYVFRRAVPYDDITWK